MFYCLKCICDFCKEYVDNKFILLLECVINEFIFICDEMIVLMIKVIEVFVNKVYDQIDVLLCEGVFLKGKIFILCKEQMDCI